MEKGKESGAEAWDYLKLLVLQLKGLDRTRIVSSEESACLGRCGGGPIMRVYDNINRTCMEYCLRATTAEEAKKEVDRVLAIYGIGWTPPYFVARGSSLVVEPDTM
ncbi:hypothetical protein L0Y69_01855 [bacterium]|nr:hypothetical protein [bacterium]